MDTFTYTLTALILCAFFSGMEIAFITSNKMRFELEKKTSNITSSLLTIFYNNPQQYIATMIVGRIIALVIFVYQSSTLLLESLPPMYSPFWIIVVHSIFTTAIVIVAVGIIPKMVFRVNPNLWLKLFSWGVYIFYIGLYPISKLVSWLTFKFLKVIHLDLSITSQSNIFSFIDLNYLLMESFESTGSVKERQNEVKLFQKALDFSGVKLRDCFVPRTEVVAVERGTDPETVKQKFIETGISKLIVYEKDIDEIVGYIHTSEMFEHQNVWDEYIKTIPIVPETMAAQKLMRIFMEQKKSIAAVVDEFGGTSGIITLEDVMEQIFGQIEDEHDTKKHIAEQINENEYQLAGRLEIEEINKLFKLNIPQSDDYATIAGYILHKHQHFPKLNEIIRINSFTFQCTEVTNNRIKTVKMAVNK